MPITIDGTGSISGLSAGGLPDNSIITADIANGAVTQAKRSEQLTLGTAVASTSGTSVDFTGIPSWVKRVTVMFNGMSTSGTSIKQVQLGTSSGATTSGYAAAYAVIATAANTTSTALISTGFGIGLSSATDTISGSLVFINVTGNTWCGSGTLVNTTGGNATSTVAGTISLSGTLDRVRITTVNGTDTFDAGSINILYE